MYQRGFLLIEGLLAAALTSLVVGAIAGVYLSTSQVHEQKLNDKQMLLLAHEGLAVARSVRDADSANFPTGTFGVATSSGAWAFSGSQDMYDGFTRSVTVSAVDADTFKVSASVTDGSRTRSLATHLTRWLEVIVSGIGDWSSPNEEDSLSLSGNDNGVKVQIQGDYAYVVRSGNGTNFYVLDISDPTSLSVVGSTSLSSILQDIFVLGNYAYVASSSNGNELMIVDVSSPSSPSLTGSFNAAGNQNARGIFVVGTTAYLVLDDGSNDELVIINVLVPSAPVKLGGEDLNNDANDIVVMGNYAYVATDGNELEVVDISNSALPNSIHERNFSGGGNGISIAGYGNHIYLGRSSGEIEIVDVSNPASTVVDGSFDVEDDVRDIAVGNSGAYLFVASDENDAEFQIVDVSSPGSPSLVGSVNESSDFLGVAYSESEDLAILVGEANSAEIFAYTGS